MSSVVNAWCDSCGQNTPHTQHASGLVACNVWDSCLCCSNGVDHGVLPSLRQGDQAHRLGAGLRYLYCGRQSLEVSPVATTGAAGAAR